MNALGPLKGAQAKCNCMLVGRLLDTTVFGMHSDMAQRRLSTIHWKWRSDQDLQFCSATHMLIAMVRVSLYQIRANHYVGDFIYMSIHLGAYYL